MKGIDDLRPIVTGVLAAVCVTSLAANALLYLRYSPARPGRR